MIVLSTSKNAATVGPCVADWALSSSGEASVVLLGTIGFSVWAVVCVVAGSVCGAAISSSFWFSAGVSWRAISGCGCGFSEVTCSFYGLAIECSP